MTENDFLATVLDLLKMHRWRSIHVLPGLTQSGNWRTAVAGDGKGFLDVLAIRPPRLLVAELKVGNNKLTSEQEEWKEAWERMPNAEVFVWRPEDLQTIADVLR